MKKLKSDKGRSTMNVLSLFDGMGCAWIALRELGIKVGKGYSSEIDKHAVHQVEVNFPEVERLGSVTEVDVPMDCCGLRGHFHKWIINRGTGLLN